MFFTKINGTHRDVAVILPSLTFCIIQNHIMDPSLKYVIIPKTQFTYMRILRRTNAAKSIISVLLILFVKVVQLGYIDELII